MSRGRRGRREPATLWDVHMRSLLSLDGWRRLFRASGAHRPTAAASDKRILLPMTLATSSRERNMRTWRLPLLVATVIFGAPAASAAETKIERGKYLVTIAGCGSCHTPGALLGKPDAKRLLAGSEVGFTIPGLGAFVGRNLTPDKETGLGNWTDDQIISAITAGIRRMAVGSPRSCPGRVYRIYPPTTRTPSSPI